MRSVCMIAAVLCFAVVTAASAPVDPDSPNGIAASESGSDGVIVWFLTTGGEVWCHSPGSGWEHESYMSPPVPANELALWWPRFCATADGRFFRYEAPAWVEVPAPAFFTVPTATESLGAVKRSYR